jgi:hypothetical protein
MAATYPREVEEAARWSRERPGLSGDAAVRIARDQDWDPAVRSLLAFPLVLDTMARHMRWTEDLGDAFLDQRSDVMDTVQRLRARAYDAGHLRTNDYVRVVETRDGIVIESVSPQVVHVPHYDPRVVYGTWRWVAPPVYWSRWPPYYDPPGHPYPVHWGPGIGISSGFFFGGFYWPRREVRVVNVHTHYYPRTVVIERPVVVERTVEVHRPAHVHAHRDDGSHVWRHDDSRRKRAPIAAHTHAERARLAPVITPAPAAPREPTGHAHRANPVPINAVSTTPVPVAPTASAPTPAPVSPAVSAPTPTPSTIPTASTRPAPRVTARDDAAHRAPRHRDNDSEPSTTRRNEPHATATGIAADANRSSDSARPRSDVRGTQNAGNDERRPRRGRDSD